MANNTPLCALEEGATNTHLRVRVCSASSDEVPKVLLEQRRSSDWHDDCLSATVVFIAPGIGSHTRPQREKRSSKSKRLTSE
jgi:hypothetical protein